MSGYTFSPYQAGAPVHERELGNNEYDREAEVEEEKPGRRGGGEKESDRDGGEELAVPGELDALVHLLPEGVAVVQTRVVCDVAIGDWGALLPVEQIEGEGEVQHVHGGGSVGQVGEGAAHSEGEQQHGDVSAPGAREVEPVHIVVHSCHAPTASLSTRIPGR